MSYVTDRMYAIIREKGENFNTPIFTLCMDDMICRIGEMIPEAELNEMDDEELYALLTKSIMNISKAISWYELAGQAILDADAYLKRNKERSKEYDVTIETVIKVRANSEGEIHSLAMEKLKEALDTKQIIHINFEESDTDQG